MGAGGVRGGGGCQDGDDLHRTAALGARLGPPATVGARLAGDGRGGWGRVGRVGWRRLTVGGKFYEWS